MAPKLLLLPVVAALSSLPTMADFFNVTFTTHSGSPSPTFGSFNYDPTHPKFSDFFVVFDGITFDLTNSANNPQVTTCCPNTLPFTGTAADTFAMLTNALPNEPSNAGVEWLGNATKPSFSLHVELE